MNITQRGRRGGITVVTITSLDEFFDAVTVLCGDAVVHDPNAWAEEIARLENEGVIEIRSTHTLDGRPGLIELSPDGTDRITRPALIGESAVTITLTGGQ